MSELTTDADLAVAIAVSLYASGIPAAPQVADGEAWLMLALEPDLSVMGWFELADLIHVVVEDADAERVVMRGPLAPDDERCSDPFCVSARILAWVLAWRAEAWQ